MPAHGLQSLAAPGPIIAVIDHKQRAALAGKPACQSTHQRRGRKARLENLSGLAGRLELRHGIRSKAKAKAPFGIEPNEPLMPAVLRANELAYRQAIDEFIRNDDGRSARKLLGRSMPMWRRARARESRALRLPQRFAHLDEVKLDRAQESWQDARSPQCVRHQRAAARTKFGEIIGLWSAAVWQAMGAPKPLIFAELGPGRGTLMADALRAARILPGFLSAIELHLVEMSEPLRQAQRAALA